MSYITLVLSVCLIAAVASSSQQDKRSVISIEPAAWPGVAAWVQSGHGGWSSDTSSDVAGAVAAAKAAATAVMAAQHEVAAAKHAALEQQSVASAKEAAAARAAHKRLVIRLLLKLPQIT
nr:uncharacterized protein LOC110377228 [Helicoverpa armigera]